ncbi:MAG: hypothetical protein QE271_10095 [Bacteriovoracaceae bacterium]|nr:hypothetical protein [Bacteriovoracaceae bacterium]
MIKLFFTDEFHLLITFGLVVLIWIIQILHYPSFHFYDEKEFPKAMLFHQRSISYLTLPLMVSELTSACWSIYQSYHFLNLVCLLLVVLIWLSTFFIQVPLHNQLLLSKDQHLIAKLIKTNWIRTCAWTMKFMLLSWNFL